VDRGMTVGGCCCWTDIAILPSRRDEQRYDEAWRGWPWFDEEEEDDDDTLAGRLGAQPDGSNVRLIRNEKARVSLGCLASQSHQTFVRRIINHAATAARARWQSLASFYQQTYPFLANFGCLGLMRGTGWQQQTKEWVGIWDIRSLIKKDTSCMTTKKRQNLVEPPYHNCETNIRMGWF
jgi:hypothetical protein